jgi:bile acid:Na+ symporter, BASS family
MNHLPKILGICVGLVALVVVGLWLGGHGAACAPFVIGFFLLLAFTMRGFPLLRSFAFTASVLTSVSIALFYPRVYGEWFGFHLDLLIVPLTQIIMFGMGTTLTPGDFARVMKFPWPVFIGLLLHFTVMPLVAVLITKAFGFHGELAAGIILIGSVSAGMASNLMCYLAKGNVALSVTMTAFSTLAAPFLTPLLMAWLAGQLIPVDVHKMMLSIVNMILVPIAAGLVANSILYSRKSWANRASAVLGIAVACVSLGVVFIILPRESLGALAPLKTGAVAGCCMIGVVAMARFVMSIVLRRTDDWMDTALPVTSMSAICLVVGIITAQTRDVLLAVGPLLVFASLLHNVTGYTLGYWLARLMGRVTGIIGHRLGFYPTPGTRMNEADCRTVAIEVGMQNGGMATGLAIDVLKSKVAALPPGIFGTTMNITASLLANYWKRRPVREETAREGELSGAANLETPDQLSA